MITDFDEALDGFYDLLNLRFQRIQLGEQMRLAATVASGSYSVLTPVHPHFQLVVCIRASELEETPLPFLNRFEKFYLSLRELSNFQALQLCQNPKITSQMLETHVLQPVRDRLQELVQLIGPASLIGYQAATLNSAIIQSLRSPQVLETMELFSASWDTARQTEREPVPQGFPGDLSESTLMDHEKKRQIALSKMACHGFENAGNTCYLAACLILLCLHEDQWLGEAPDTDADGGISQQVRRLLKASRGKTVRREEVKVLEKELRDLGLVGGRFSEEFPKKHPKKEKLCQHVEWIQHVCRLVKLLA